MITAVEAAEKCRITYRQLDHWCRKGWVETNGGGSSGVPRWLDWQQMKTLQAMAQLVNAGVRPEEAVKIARGDRDAAGALLAALEAI